MTGLAEQASAKMRRSLDQEFIRMEDDFDKVRESRMELVDKLVGAAKNVKLVDQEGNPTDTTLTSVAVINTALKALSDTEKATEKAVSLKLRRNEAEAASAAATKERIEIVLKATAPGRIEDQAPFEKLEETLGEMFGDSIQDFELKTNPRSLEESVSDDLSI